MTKPTKQDLKERVIMRAREYGIQMVLFRNEIGERLGVNVTAMECLGFLYIKGHSTPSELARYTGLSSGATTAMLDRLEKSGLIERRPNPDDRRGTLIVLAKAGAKRVAPWFASVRKVQDELVSSYSDEELATICDFFERYIKIREEERKKFQQESVGK